MTPKIKPEIIITYRAYLDPDLIQEQLDNGSSLEDIQKDLRKFGIKSDLVDDFEIKEIEDVSL